MTTIDLETPYTVSIDAELSGNLEIGLTAGIITGNGVPYLGEYVAVPKPYEQTFETKKKTMKDNFVVKEILVLEENNDYGTTLTIGA